MGRFGIPEDQPIQNSFISRSLESAQAKIEGFNFDSRKHTLEYDNVMNHQRNIVYARRRLMLSGDQSHLEEFIKELESIYPDLASFIIEKRAKFGDGPFFETVRRIALHVTDTLWVEHLETMEYTRSSVNLRAYGQREPLIEYKKEGLHLFKDMEANFREQVSSFIKTMNLEGGVETEVIEEKPEIILNLGGDVGVVVEVARNTKNVMAKIHKENPYILSFL
jgi:preprotein translocase subunit SecA